MKQYALIRTTKVMDHVKHLPRPKLTQDVIMISNSRESIERVLDTMYWEEKNQSTDEIEVALVVTEYKGQKTGTSSRPNNGKRN